MYYANFNVAKHQKKVRKCYNLLQAKYIFIMKVSDNTGILSVQFLVFMEKSKWYPIYAVNYPYILIMILVIKKRISDN